MIAALFFALGLCFGSFVNALVWRLHEHKNWVNARSQCPNCAHKLVPKDLLPILSWLSLRGKCRYCHAPIAKHYPFMELLGGIWFSSSYLFWPADLGARGQLVLFVSWLIVSVGLLALLLYDYLWMILPNKIIYTSLFIALSGRLSYILFYSDDIALSFELLALSLLVASGIFFMLYQISKGQWIGFGDVRLGFLTGTVLASPSKSLLMIFTASVIGVVVALPSLFTKKRTLSDRLPYGPFLIIGTVLVLFFGQDFFFWYNHVFLIR